MFVFCLVMYLLPTSVPYLGGKTFWIKKHVAVFAQLVAVWLWAMLLLLLYE